MNEGAIVIAATSSSERRLRRENDRLATELMQARARLARLQRRDDRLEKDGARPPAELVSLLLPTLDNLGLALAVPGGGSLREGVALVYRELARTLGRLGLSVVEPRPGEHFDPQLHEAASLALDSGQPFGTIVTVRRTGYSLEGRLLRAALVDVAA